MRQKTGWVIVLTAIGSLMAALDTLVVARALSTIRVDLGASVEALEWTVNAYNLSFAVLLITAGRSATDSDAATCTPPAWRCSPWRRRCARWRQCRSALIAARALQGVGAAFVIPLGLTLLSAAFPPERRGAAIGIFSAITGVSVALGPLVGGAVVEGLAWEWIFWLNVPIGAVAVPLVLTRMQESRGPDTGLDLPGLALVSAGALAIVWGLVRGNAAGWGSAEVLISLTGGALLIAAFVGWERRAREPMLPLRLFRSRGFAASNVAMFFTFATLFTAVYFFAQFLQVGLGYGPLDAGLRLMPWTATFITVAPVAGALADRIGERPLMTVGLSLQAVGLGWLALIAEPGLAYASLVPSLIVAGVGISLAIPAAQNSAVGSVELTAIGKAAATNSMMRELGGVFGIAVAVAVFAAAGSYASPAAFVDGFASAIGVGALFALAGAAAGLALPARHRRSPTGGQPMKQVMVRYKVKPELVAENEALVRAVYDELHAVAPADFRYATFRLEDGVSFVHLAWTNGDAPLPKLAAFQRFTAQIRDRCDEPPAVTELAAIGAYRL